MIYRFFRGASVLLVVVLFAAGCGNKPSEPTVTDTPAAVVQNSVQEPAQALPTEFMPIPGEYIVQTDLSTVIWEGKGVGKSHTGTIDVNNGSFVAGTVAFDSGSFSIDMASIVESNGNDAVITHLKSPDFFDVEAYPESTFVLTGMQRNAGNSFTISGNLTIKGATHTILFPAFIENIADGYHATAAFSIDRTKWGVRYGSDNFFDNLGDKAVNDMIRFELDLTAISKESIQEEQK